MGDHPLQGKSKRRSRNKPCAKSWICKRNVAKLQGGIVEKRMMGNRNYYIILGISKGYI